MQVSQELRGMSKIIDEMLLDDEELVEFTCNEVTSEHLNLIVDYCTHYKFEKTATDIEHPLPCNDPAIFIKDDWERDFAKKLDLDGLSDLLMAANYFNIPAIFELCCAMIASYFKGKDFEKIKGEFGLDDVVYTPENEEQLKAEYPWIMDQAQAKIDAIQAEIEKKANQQ